MNQIYIPMNQACNLTYFTIDDNAVIRVTCIPVPTSNIIVNGF